MSSYVSVSLGGGVSLAGGWLYYFGRKGCVTAIRDKIDYLFLTRPVALWTKSSLKIFRFSFLKFFRILKFIVGEKDIYLEFVG